MIANWTWTAFVQAVLIALATVLLIYLPYMPVKVFLGVLLIWFVFALMNNPLTFWRRVARLVVLTFLPTLVLGLQFEATGEVDAGEFGNLVFQVANFSESNLLFVIVVLVLALVFDLFVYWLQFRGKSNSNGQHLDAPLKLARGADGSVRLSGMIGAFAEQSCQVTGARLKLYGLFPLSHELQIYARRNEAGALKVPVSGNAATAVEQHQGMSFQVDQVVAAGFLARWLLFVTLPWLAWLPMTKGQVSFRSLPGAAIKAEDVQLQRVS